MTTNTQTKNNIINVKEYKQSHENKYNHLKEELEKICKGTISLSYNIRKLCIEDYLKKKKINDSEKEILIISLLGEEVEEKVDLEVEEKVDLEVEEDIVDKRPKFLLNSAPTQFVAGKTSEAIMQILKNQEIDYSMGSSNIFPCAIVYSRNSSLETEQWTARVGIKCKKVITLSSKCKSKTNENHAKNELDILNLFLETDKADELPNCLVMCNHPQRIKDMVKIIKKFQNNTVKLDKKTGYTSIKFDIYFDESPLCTSNFNNFITSLDLTNKNKSSDIGSIMFITATPDDEKFIKKLKELEIYYLLRDWQKTTPEEYIKLSEKYRSIYQHEKIYHKHPTNDNDPVEYVRSYLPNIKSKSNIIFCPSTYKVKGHEKMCSMFLKENYIVIIHNGTNKEFRFPNGRIITIDQYKKDNKIVGDDNSTKNVELRHVLVHFRKKYPKSNIAITGNNTIGTGVTWVTKGFKVTHAIFSKYFAKNSSELRQFFGRATGHIDYVDILKIIAPKEVFLAYFIKLENLERVMRENPKIICIENLDLKGDDCLAHNVPIIVNITENDIEKIKSSKSKERKKIIYELVKNNLPSIDYCFDNFIYNTCPLKPNSYEKHITNVLKMAEQNKKGGIMDIKWSKKQYEKHYAYKCWLVYIDAKENRLIIILWDGSRLPDIIRQPYIKLRNNNQY
jgi:hypothetical protein